MVAITTSPPGAEAGEVNGGRFPTEEVFVDQAYRDILRRSPDAGGLGFWSERIRGGQTPETLIEDLITSPEFEGSIAPVVRLYRAIFNRLPDQDGLEFWVDQYRAGRSLDSIAEAFLAGAEFEALAGASTTDEVVEAVYGRSLGRTPDAEGLDFWRGEIDAGRQTLPSFIALVSESAEHQTLRRGEVAGTLIYLGLLQRLPEPGGLEFWANAVNEGLPIREFAAAVMALPEYQSRFAGPPTISTEVIATGLNIPWDIDSLPSGELLVTERRGGLIVIDADGTQRRLTADLSDLFSNGETGMMGLAIDANFAENRRVYTCQGHSSPREIQIIAWTLDEALTTATRANDPLIGGLPIVTGRHGGCQLEIDGAGNLFVGTGDAAVGTTPQDLTSLGGKVLRVDALTGAPVAGNPFIDSANANTQLLYTYGHRNVQGLALRPGTTEMWSVEHGPARDDEVNRLLAGANAGWNPVPGYNEQVSMTNLGLANADPAEWSTGSPTLALAGGAWLDDSDWGSFDGGLAVTALKNQTLRFLFFNDDGLYLGQRVVLDGEFGRLRAVHQAPDGSIYVSTSTGSDRIIRLTASN